MAKRNGVPKITKAWLEWAKQHGACAEDFGRLKVGDPFTKATRNVDWVSENLRRDGIPDYEHIYDDFHWEWLMWRLSTYKHRRLERALILRIAREVEIVDA